MYEFNDVPEPTRKGWWWFTQRGYSEPLYVYHGIENKFHCDHRNSRGGVGKRLCKRMDGTWTGPISMPEDKPATDIPEYPDHEPRLRGRPARIDEHGRVETGFEEPAPSEDAYVQREAAGARFWSFYHELCLKSDPSDPPWAALHADERAAYGEAALRFRAERVGPWKKALSRVKQLAHELYGTLMAGQDEVLRLDGELVPTAILKEYEARLSALPDQGEVGEEPVCPCCGGLGRRQGFGYDLSDADGKVPCQHCHGSGTVKQTAEDKARPSDEGAERLDKGQARFHLDDQEKKVVLFMRKAKIRTLQVERAHALLSDYGIPEVVEDGGNSIDARVRAAICAKQEPSL